jgi:D-alanyl-D-alanine carboxypeptidase (penicillin-binding protein 5/6)
MGGSQIWLEPGEEMTVEELLKAVSIVSANDASYTLAEHLAGSEENFIALMNQRAKELGLKNTTYVNTTGLEPDGGGVGNLTSARDMGILAKEVLKYPYVLKWTGTWIDHLRGGQSFLRNTNKLVRFFRGCDGLKTGFTGKAGFCLVATAKRDGVRMIAVVMKASNDKVRAKDITTLFNYGFSKYKAQQLYKGGETVGKVRVFRGRQKFANAVVAGELSVVVRRDEKKAITKKINLLPLIKAPVASGQKIGEVTLAISGKPCGRIDLIATKEIKRNSLFGIWKEILRSILRTGVNKAVQG